MIQKIAKDYCPFLPIFELADEGKSKYPASDGMKAKTCKQHASMVDNIIHKINDNMKTSLGSDAASKLEVKKLAFIAYGTRDQVSHTDQKTPKRCNQAH